ncbi:MAG: pilus assembly protein TadG-related protein [Planctomycetes bacterium]|nr:pilus assembly protein TadG-related protein [Planctomycetota bacterium]
MRKKYFRRGFSLVLTAMSGLALIGLMGLATDTAWVFLSAHQLQNAADAAALAGADQLRQNAAAAQDEAIQTAAANTAGDKSVQLVPNSDNAAGGDVVIGVWRYDTQTFTPTLVYPNAVQVVARRTSNSLNGALPLFFGQMFGITTVNVSRSAIAANTAPNGIITLALTGPGTLDLHDAGANVQVENGSIYVNSDSSNAVQTNTNAMLSGTDMFIVGNEPTVASFTGGNIFPNSSVLTDPIVADGLTPPAQPALSDTAANANVAGAPLDPGYYPNGISHSHVLASGIYWIDGGINLSADSHGILDGSAGVLLYINSGAVNMGNYSELELTAMTTGPYANISMWQSASDTDAATLQGTPGFNNTGLLYFPSASVTAVGNGSILANMLIANTLTAVGNGSVVIDYNGLFPSGPSFPHLVH